MRTSELPMIELLNNIDVSLAEAKAIADVIGKTAYSGMDPHAIFHCASILQDNLKALEEMTTELEASYHRLKGGNENATGAANTDGAEDREAEANGNPAGPPHGE